MCLSLKEGRQNDGLTEEPLSELSPKMSVAKSKRRVSKGKSNAKASGFVKNKTNEVRDSLGQHNAH